MIAFSLWREMARILLRESKRLDRIGRKASALLVLHSRDIPVCVHNADLQLPSIGRY